MMSRLSRFDLPKPMPGSITQILLPDARFFGCGGAFQQERPDLGHGVVIARVILHGPGGPLHVHDDVSHPRLRRPGLNMPGSSRPRGDVIDDGGSLFQRGAGDLSRGGIDTGGEIGREFLLQLHENRNYALQLFIYRYPVRSRARGFLPRHR